MDIKSLVKKAIYDFFAKDVKQITTRIKNAEVVSFDIFDTLIKRDVPKPSDIFSIMEQQLVREGSSAGKEFANKRIEAERVARMKFPDREVTLKDIYACMQLDDDRKDHLMFLECQTERAVSTPHIPLKQVYEECIQQGKTIIFISDMYLPSEIILDILQKNGYTTGRLYVSSESGYTKRSGSLFKYIQEQEKISPNKWLHIGDTIVSDYTMPKKLGIGSCLIEHKPEYNTIIDRKLSRSDRNYQALTQFINNRIGKYSNFYEQLGYVVLGPLLYGFVKWLDAQNLDNESIVFLAREGALLKKAFEIVSKRPSVYLSISRRAALCAAISQIDDYGLVSQDNMRTMKKGHTNKELALNYGLSEQEIKGLFSSAGLDEKQIISSSDMEDEVLKVIWPAAQKKSEKQHMLLQRYLAQLGISDSCTVVDVGWSGTIQALLNRSDFSSGEKNIKWSGCYFGLLKKDTVPIYQDNLKKGWLFAEGSKSDKLRIRETIISTSSFFEIMFLQTDGTTERYDETENGNVYPVKGKPDNDESLMISNIEAMQNTGLQFVSDMQSSLIQSKIDVNSDVAVANYLAFVEKISLADIRKLRNFKEKDGVTDIGASLSNEHGFLHYVLHPQKFKTDFSRNTCKLFFLKGVFKLPLPYVPMLTFFRKHFRTY